MPGKIVIITTGQPSTNPRMVKEYKALKQAGYQVKVLYSHWAAWAEETDKQMFESGALDKRDFTLTGGSLQEKRWKYFLSRVLHKVSRKLSRLFPRNFSDLAIARPAWFLMRAAKKERADLYIAHNLGALAPACRAAAKFKSRFAFDAEDFHRGEVDLNSSFFTAVVNLEDAYIPKANYITAASPHIGKAYADLYHLKNIAIVNNCFSKKYLKKVQSHSKEVLTLFWFSQTIGPGRGLETVVHALEQTGQDCDIQLHLMGDVSASYVQDLRALTSFTDRIHFIEPVAPDHVFEVASRFDIGLGVEVPVTRNRDFCLTNKIFTYLLAGNCLVLSDTSAQKQFIDTYPEVGFLYPHHDVHALSLLLRKLFSDRETLNRCRLKASELAETDCNWESESTLLLTMVRKAILN